MVNIRRYIALAFLPLFMVMLLGGCCEEEFASFTNGTLQLNIGHVSQKTETRATPAQLGKPLVEKFTLKIQRIGNGYASYEGAFVDNLELNVGTYNIMAYYGENVLLGKDCPYYEGSATATIEKDQSTSATIPCRVANALVSVAFGRDEAERARFKRTSRKSHSAALSIYEVDALLHDYFDENQYLTRQKFEQLCGFTSTTAARHLKRLIGEGRLINTNTKQSPVYEPVKGYYGRVR